VALQSKLSLTAAILAVACAHRQPPAAHVLKLTVERHGHNTAAWVNTTAYGHPLKLLIDTGGAINQLPSGFVEKYKIPYRTGLADPMMIDVNGNGVRMARAYGVPIQFPGSAVEEKIDFIVNTLDHGTTEGLLIPQDLVSSGWALIIDLEHEELRYEPEAEAVKRAGPNLQELDYKTCELDNHRVAEIRINGVDSSLIVDTGASRSALSRNNESIPSMMSQRGNLGTTSSGTSTGVNFTVENVQVEFAKTPFKISPMILPSSQRCGKGLLGADILSQCVVIWGVSKLWASCHPAK
jgi:hypothetical protein